MKALAAGAAVAARADPVFAIQLVVSVVGLGLSVAMLLTGRETAAYLPVVTSIIGYWLPAPGKKPRAAETDDESVASVMGGAGAGSPKKNMGHNNNEVTDKEHHGAAGYGERHDLGNADP